ncbi:hypothetical protein TNCV_1295751 [Trichonephila clavipes]|uniref:PiggyBac transposable element-derived protein 4 C-terminal zinc-ribbon domain-containing protein n=1 Tax=Trichonephila clavipes TaxID=2585209 RepID=A0A8X6VN41_TRICX|nr:hypothetical protein TNCV_1295751 [Trichonephila clavipes]
MNYRIAIGEQNKLNVQLPGTGRPSVGSLLVKGRHFPEHIPPTGKNIYSNLTVFYMLWCKTDEKGKRIRRETRVYCKECGMGLCAVQ